MDVCKVDKNVIQYLTEISNIAEELQTAKDGRRCPSVPYFYHHHPCYHLYAGYLQLYT